MTTEAIKHHDHGHEHNSNMTDTFGFWIYIMTDCVLFATLFATFIVLRNNTFGSVSLKELISLPYVFYETLFLLVSNLTFGFAILSSYKGYVKRVLFWLALTFIFGLGFVVMEVNEFVQLFHEGHGWHTNAALSSFFTLVGTHGLHVSLGLLWILIMIIQVAKFKINQHTSRRLTYLGLFWNFLDIVWIFVFTIVYLMGAA